MNPFFEVSSEEIAQLDDGTLRDLVGLLCETEYRKRGRDTSGVLWGGHQDAPDGGFDVVVRGDNGLKSPRYLTRANVGFQVKKPGMPPSKIKPEMVKNGKLRPEIEALADQAGAYIIVSSGDTCSASSLKKRIDQMTKSVSVAKHADLLLVDFVDSSRLATWVRNHQALILWVKTRIGKPYKGWRPFGGWAHVPTGAEDKYLVDDQVRVFKVGSNQTDGLSALEAIGQLRETLRLPGTSTRIAGLSGVGKTRFVQALFETDVGENSLDPASVFYADIANSPEPDPKSLIEQMAVQRTKAIFVLDNCPPQLHLEASRVVSGPDSTISLLTVEYDVREDLPPETDVLRLEPSSLDLINKMVVLHHPHIGSVDAEKIAEFSGGNARIADALAATVKSGETLSGLKDEELFKRLFHQRHDTDGDLQRSAEVLSLVYSYDGVSISAQSELSILASIIDKDAKTLYTDTAILIDRDLVQSRSNWRAVLPHALSNRLAAIALKKNSLKVVEEAILGSGQERLVRSFSRRLGYLHDSEHAQTIVRNWIKPDGWIGESVSSLSDFGLGVLKNIAPVAPEATLAAVEIAVSKDADDEFTSPDNMHRMEFVHLLRSIAYDPDCFIRCCDVLLAFALSEGGDGQATENLAEMFWITLSGTHAAPELRHDYIKRLIQHQNLKHREIGIRLLRESLESEMFSSSHNFDFGARPRNHGFRPKNDSDVHAWFTLFIGYAKAVALDNPELKDEVRKILASKLRGLWQITAIRGELEETILELHTDRPWGEGWVAIRQILRLDSDKEDNEESRKRLMALETKLRPQNLIDKARTYAMGDVNHDLDYIDEEADDENTSGYQRATQITREIAEDVARDDEAVDQLLPEMASKNGARIGVFGEGLAAGTDDPKALWERTSSAVRQVPKENRNLSILLGFISGYSERDSAAVKAILEGIVDDDDFGEAFPYFQAAAGVDSSALPRFMRSLDLRKAPIHSYFRLGMGRSHEGFSDNELISLLERIECEEGGIEVVGDILKMRLFGIKDGNSSAELREFARNFLEIVPLKCTPKSDSLQDYDLKLIAKHALVDQASGQTAQKFCDRLLESNRSGGVYLWRFPGILSFIAKNQPEAFLNAFFGKTQDSNERNFPIFTQWFERHDNPLTHVPDTEIAKWCRQNPSSRVARVARDMTFFRKDEDDHRLEWRGIFDTLLEIAPDKQAFLGAVFSTLRPWSWSGKRSKILKARKGLLEKLNDHPEPVVREWAKSAGEKLDAEIEFEISREREEQEARDERFE